MNFLYLRNTPWEDNKPSETELQELEYTQLEQNNGNGKGNGNGNQTNVPINGGLWFVLIVSFLFGIYYSKNTTKWKQSRI